MSPGAKPVRVRLPVLPLCAAALLGGCAREAVLPAATRIAERPAAGVDVPPGADLQQAIDAAEPGAVLRLLPGRHRGPVRIGKPVHLWGPADAIVTANEGSTVRVETNGASLRGFTVAGSGQRFDLMDGGIRVHGDDTVIEGVTVKDSLFGVLVERSKRVTLRGNNVIGTGLPAMGLRGDGIRLWETTDSTVADNVVVDSRDVVVWYSSRNRLVNNTVERSRYGTHFMYSHGNVVEDSRYVGDEVSVFVMYSHDITLRRNLFARAGGAAGVGLGLKESGNVAVEDNWFLADTVGIYIDNSPLDLAHENRFVRNSIRFAETAVSLHAGTRRTEFADNEFRDNGAVVKVGGRGNALGCTFAGNWYDSYQGYDLDGDGRGDVPFEFRRLSTQLEGRYPELALLHGAPVMGMLDVVGEVMPLFSPECLLRDDAPRARALPMTWRPEVDRAD